MIRLPMLLPVALLPAFTLSGWGESEDNPPFSQNDLDCIPAAYNLSLDHTHLADMAKRARNIKSRGLAEELAPEHKEIAITLRDLARKEVGSAIAVPMSGEHPATDALRDKTGARFVRAYIAAPREVQQKEIVHFKPGHSHTLRRFATSELPALRSNLEFLRGHFEMERERF